MSNFSVDFWGRTHSSELVGWLVGGLVGWWVGGLVGWWVGWLVGGLVGWWGWVGGLVGGLVGWWVGRPPKQVRKSNQCDGFFPELVEGNI